jgi:hypothetical protein
MRSRSNAFPLVIGGTVLALACDTDEFLRRAAGPEVAPSVRASVTGGTAPCPAAECPAAGTPSAAVAIEAAATGAAVMSTSWFQGDLFFGVSDGTYQVLTNSGLLKETIRDGLGGFTTGCSMNPLLDALYTTNFGNTRVVVYNDAAPHAIRQVVNTSATSPDGHSESIVFDAAGNYYVGHPDGNRLIHKYSPAGALLMTYAVATENRGSDWIELAKDQRTLFHTSEGGRIFRYDLAQRVQLADFANVESYACVKLCRLVRAEYRGSAFSPTASASRASRTADFVVARITTSHRAGPAPHQQRQPFRSSAEQDRLRTSLQPQQGKHRRLATPCSLTEPANRAHGSRMQSLRDGGKQGGRARRKSTRHSGPS